MNQLFVNDVPDHNSNCSDPMTRAERELAALFSAVKESFGSEDARLAAKDWLDELAAMNVLPVSTREWRQITVKVFARLVSRVRASSFISRILPIRSRLGA